MSLVKINGNVKYIDETMVMCREFRMFHPEQATALEEYKKNHDLYLEYSPNTGYLRKIVDLAGKLGLGTFENKIPELKKFDNQDRVNSSYDKNTENINNNINIKNKTDISSQVYCNPYKKLLQDLTEIFSKLNIKTNEVAYNNLNLSFEEMQENIDEIKSRIVYLSKQRFEQEKKISEYLAVLTQLENIDDARIDFDELFSCEYLKIRFGRLPKESYEKLKVVDNEKFLFFSFKIDSNYSWCLYMTPVFCSKEVDSIFKSLFFERIRIPVYAHGSPDSTKYYVKNQINKYQSMLKYIDDELLKLKQSVEKKLIKIYSKVNFFYECFENKKYAAIFEDQFYVVGFIPKELEQKFMNKFKDLNQIDITISEPESDKRLNTPVKLKNNRFSQPFEEFVAMYGLPSYKDIDPTLFLSISYTVLFGIMFGDIGQGLIIALVGHLLWKLKNNNFARILTRIGLSSCFFGFIYGSCFGYEDLFEGYILNLPVPYREIMLKITHRDTNTLLLGAVAIGVIAIVCSMIFNIMAGIKRRKSGVYLFGHNGLAGLVFYLSVVLAIFGMSVLKIDILSPWFIIGFVIFPLVLIFLKEPLGDKVDGREIEIHDGLGGFIIENFFELYDVLLGFMSNTISFIRVGAFVLSHAGMMMVIMSFVNNMSFGGKIGVLIFGNIFVMVFEGLIVGIQVLRLQFYEMFSRCFDGAGRPFKNM